MKSSLSLVSVSTAPSLPPQLATSPLASPETLMVSPPPEPFTKSVVVLPVRLSLSDLPTTPSMNGAVAVSQVTVLVPSVAVPAARFTLRLAVMLPHEKHRSSWSAAEPGWSPFPVILSRPQPGSKMYLSWPGLSTSVSLPKAPVMNSNPPSEQEYCSLSHTFLLIPSIRRVGE